MAKNKDIRVESMVASRSGEPAVMLRIGDQFVNMPTEDARKVALDLIGAADRAELEAKLVGYLRRSGVDEAGVGQALALLRKADEE